MPVVDKYSKAATPPPVDVASVDFLSRMAELVPGIIYIFNHRTQSNEYSNRSLSELLGYSSQELIDMGDKLIEIVVHEEDLPDLVAYFDSLGDLADGEYASFDYRDYAKDGSVVWLRSIDTVFERDAEGRVLRHLGIASDITAEKQAELKLRRLNAELEAQVRRRTQELEDLNAQLEERVIARTCALREANRELEQLSYVATHDLKVPINNMSSLTQMLNEARADLPPEHRETLDWMKAVCDQASGKLEALVRVAQANAVWEEDFVEVDLAEVVERVLTNLNSQISEAGAAVRLSLDARHVRFRPVEMENMLQALIGNALKYRHPGRRCRVEVGSARAGNMICVSVRDNGSGLNLPSDLDKVFGLFQRAHVSPEGSGVALYTIRRILQGIGGRIEVAGTAGTGCTFSMYFPCAERSGT